eukprot:TRINITY_DN21687_c0_g1_i2.p1 TRINITY_DN21687_c0_g1~~TRINITY_DN21687_c0_g1_i2.p1  ORF type:complete len:264 (-),score=79.42 TRINITY_DN21687_c0_g1_i2:522-1313(-)
MSLSHREVVDFDPLANPLEDDPAIAEPEETFVPPVVKPRPKPAEDSSEPARAAKPKKKQPAPEPAPRVIPEFTGFGEAVVEEEEVFDQSKKPARKCKKTIDFKGAEEEVYSSSLFGAADAEDTDEVEALFGNDQHKPLVQRVEQEQDPTGVRKRFERTKLAAPTNDSSSIAETLASINNETEDDLFLDSLSNKSAAPLFPEKDCKVASPKQKPANVQAGKIDDDLFSMGGASGANDSSVNTSGFDFGSYIAQNQGKSGGGLFD